MFFYIAKINMSSSAMNGVIKKIHAQCQALKKSFDQVLLIMITCQTCYLLDGEKILEKKVTLTGKDAIQQICAWIDGYKAQYVYARFDIEFYFLDQLFKYTHSKNIKSLLEIPTYPYYVGETNKAWIINDTIVKEEIPKYTKRVTTYTNDKEIWGLPCIKLFNTLDMDKIPMQKKVKTAADIVLICVAIMAKWNGYERLIEGLNNYYLSGGTKNIKVLFVGEGEESGNYKNLTKSYGLEDKINFLGFKSGQELDDAFNMADIGISSLGFYKEGLFSGSPIKVSEYCARGLPGVIAYNDTRFSGEENFIMKTTNDNTPIVIEDIINFYENLKQEPNYSQKIREYAKNNLSWENSMRPAIDYLLKVTSKNS